jgi:hypothetical protein
MKVIAVLILTQCFPFYKTLKSTKRLKKISKSLPPTLPYQLVLEKNRPNTCFYTIFFPKKNVSDQGRIKLVPCAKKNLFLR